MIDNIKNYFSHTVGIDSNLSFFGKVVCFPFVLFFGLIFLVVYLLVTAMEKTQIKSQSRGNKDA